MILYTQITDQKVKVWPVACYKIAYYFAIKKNTKKW